MISILRKNNLISHYPSPRPLYQGFLGLLLCFLCLNAHAWGDLGHQVVMAIAWQHLTPHSQDVIHQLLSEDQNTLTDNTPIAIATWADRYRDEKDHGKRLHYQQTHLWHFIDLDINQPDQDEACFHHPIHQGFASAGPARDCVVDKITEFSEELRRFHGSTQADERAEAILALKFLVHLVGDLHQPLHASDHHDKGGNTLQLVYRRRHTNLHHFWDTLLIDSLGHDPVSVGEKLNAAITAHNIELWQRGNALDWAKESWLTSRDLIYKPLLNERDAEFYNNPVHFQEALTIASLQLEEAGIRLAWLLNQDLR